MHPCRVPTHVKFPILTSKRLTMQRARKRLVSKVNEKVTMIRINLNVTMFANWLPIKFINVNCMFPRIQWSSSSTNCRHCSTTYTTMSKWFVRSKNRFPSECIVRAVGWDVGICKNKPCLPLQPSVNVFFNSFLITNQFSMSFRNLTKSWALLCDITLKSLLGMMINYWRGKSSVWLVITWVKNFVILMKIFAADLNQPNRKENLLRRFEIFRCLGELNCDVTSLSRLLWIVSNPL